MVQLRSNGSNKFRRDAWLDISLDNLEFNIKALYQEFQKPLIPVLKADAYGHGALVIAKTLDSFDFIYAYGVASIDEALALRQASSRRIIVLGVSPDWALEQALEADIELTVADYEAAVKINDLAKYHHKKAFIHIKLDTGMNRIGFKANTEKNLENFLDSINKIQALDHLEISTIFSHFADANNLEFCKEQAGIFQEATKDLNYPKHPASSQSIRALGNVNCDFVRCGIELYGLDSDKLKPLLSLYARISFIKEITAGESVSYKRSWFAKDNTRIATLPLGYADGLRRGLSNKIQAYCKANFYPQVGTVTMDQIMLDIGLDADIKVGDIVELIGPHIPISDWCKTLDTISYELISGFNLRLPKTYSRT